jgi:hypothetical protein
MGLFSKFSANLHHGGVKVELQAPGSIASDQVIPVTVNVTADSSQNIVKVKAELKSMARQQGVQMNSGMSFGNNAGMNSNNEFNNQNQPAQWMTVAQTENDEAFTIAPGETKSIQLQLYLNGGTPNQGLGALEGMGGALGGILKTVANLDHVNYIYEVHASADVDGIALDPSAHQSIQLLPPSGVPTVTQPASTAPQPGATPSPIAQTPESPIIVPGVITPAPQPPTNPETPPRP